MKIVYPSVVLCNAMSTEDMYKHIEQAGRVCYKSEDKISEESAEKFIRNIIARGHEAVLEHGNVTVHITCDRGVSHELVRHRIASYCQESTRYCNYSKEKFGSEISVIDPCFWSAEMPQYHLWCSSMAHAEEMYFALLEAGATPQEARSVLPNSLKTEIYVTMNIREWRHFFKLRCSSAAHPQMRQIALMTFAIFKNRWPVLFEDLEVTACPT